MLSPGITSDLTKLIATTPTVQYDCRSEQVSKAVG
jgi:hypothetical protein